MLTIRLAALSHDLDLARCRMQSTLGGNVASQEWADLIDEQRAMFLSTAIEQGNTHEDSITSDVYAGNQNAIPH